MKKLVLFISVLFIGVAASAQTFDFSPFCGWQMNGSVSFYQGELKTNDNPVYGGTLDILTHKSSGIRIMYSRTETKSYFRPYYSYGDSYLEYGNGINITNEYYQIGGIHAIPGKKIEPYGVFTVGATRFFGSEHSGSDDKWFAAFTLGAGAKIFITKQIGLKLEGAFMAPMDFGGLGFAFGSGGSGLYVENSIPILQGNFNIGLIFRISK